jgi:lysophospholipase L1-like esterase
VTTYREIHEFWLASLKQAGIPAVLMAPQRVDDPKAKRRSEEYVAVLGDLADENSVLFVNAYAQMQAAAESGRDFSGIYLDGMHLNPEGNKVIAGLLTAFEQESGYFRHQ